MKAIWNMEKKTFTVSLDEDIAPESFSLQIKLRSYW